MLLNRVKVSLLVVFVLSLVALSSVQAQSTENITIEATAGFDSYYTENQWMPIHVTVTNDGAPIDGYLEVGRRPATNNVSSYRTPLVLPTQSKKQVTLYVFPDAYVGTMRVRLRDAETDGIIASVDATGIRSLTPGDILYGVVSDEQVNLDVLETVGVELVAGDDHDASVAYLSLDDLPEVSAAWQGLDVLVFSHFDSNQLTPTQRDQLVTWVETGGQLVVMGGVGARQTAAAFDDILPVTVQDNITVESLSDLGLQLGTELAQAGQYLVTNTQLKQGEVLLRNDDLPILVRRELGSGHVSFIALDPELDPLQNSRISQQLWEKVAVTTGQPTLWEKGWINAYAAEEAARVFPELSPPSVLGLAGFLALYILIIGPVNYLVLKRMQRRELAWLTIPGIILLFLGIAYLTGFRWRGQDVLVNEVSVIRGSAESDTVQVDSIIGVYSPRRASYDLRFDENVLARVGNNDFRGGGNNSSQRAYSERSGDNLVRDFRINIADAQSLRASSSQPAPKISGTIKLNSDGNKIDVEIFNDSDIDLKDVHLFLGSDTLDLPDVDAGRRVNETLSLSLAARNMMTKIVAPKAGASVVPISQSISGGGELAVFSLVDGDRWGYEQTPEDYLRYQLLESVMNNWYGPGGESLYLPSHKIALMAWSDMMPIDVEVIDTSSRSDATTLHIIEIPVEAQ